MIYIVPESGLGNRFRAIDSALQLAIYRKTKLKIFWKVNPDVGAGFFDLFEPIRTIIGAVEVKDYPGYGYYDKPYDVYFTGLKKLFRPPVIDIPDWDALEIAEQYPDLFSKLSPEDNLYDERFEKHLKDIWDKKWPGRNLYIRTYSRFFGNPVSKYDYFKPKKEIVMKAEKIIDRYGDHITGVHIRRVDNTESIETSTTEKFISAMEAELNNNPAMKFFLATDSNEDRILMESHFKNKIIFHPSVLERGSAAGMKDALVELYCLSRTKKIIGSYYSSFTDVAVYYNGLKEYKIIT